jgi:hypothetical protein
VAKDRNPAPPRRGQVSEGKQKFVAIWSKAWGLIGAIVVVFIAARLPDTLKAGDGAQLLRDFGLLLVCFNLIMQATRPVWPIVYALPMTVAGISLWLVGWYSG